MLNAYVKALKASSAVLNFLSRILIDKIFEARCCLSANSFITPLLSQHPPSLRFYHCFLKAFKKGFQTVGCTSLHLVEVS